MKPSRVEEAPDGRDHARARDEQLARVLVGDQIELAVAKAGLDIGQAVVLLRRRAQRLGEQLKRGHPQRQLAAPRAERRAIDADQVAEIEREQALHPLGPELVDARLELDPAGAVDEVEERHLALAAAGGEATGDAMRDVGLVARAQALVSGADRRDRLDAVVLVRERLDAGRPQRVELLPPRREDVERLLTSTTRVCAPTSRRRSS